jgi:hypothetical protein
MILNEHYFVGELEQIHQNILLQIQIVKRRRLVVHSNELEMMGQNI